MQIRIFADPEQVAAAAADAIAEAFSKHGERMNLGLAGGSTPLSSYRNLTRLSLPWERVDAWFTDERWVPLDHPDSNARAAREALFDYVPATLHPAPFDEWTPDEAAADYENTLRQVLGSGEAKGAAAAIEPNLVILGMGEDGHTASLYPDTSALGEQERLYVAAWVPQRSAWRLTATIPFLQTARQLFFLVTGEHKAEAVAAVLEDEEPLPAGLVAAGANDVTWFLDEAAAAGISGGGTA